MVEITILNIAMVVIAVGFITFIVLYVGLTQPWGHRMGRHVLSFMSGIGLAFIYYVVARIFREYMSGVWTLRGWIIIMTVVAGLIWASVGLLIKYQIEARRQKTHYDYEK